LVDGGIGTLGLTRPAVNTVLGDHRRHTERFSFCKQVGSCSVSALHLTGLPRSVNATRGRVSPCAAFPCAFIPPVPPRRAPSGAGAFRTHPHNFTRDNRASHRVKRGCPVRAGCVVRGSRAAALLPAGVWGRAIVPGHTYWLSEARVFVNCLPTPQCQERVGSYAKRVDDDWLSRGHGDARLTFST